MVLAMIFAYFSALAFAAMFDSSASAISIYLFISVNRLLPSERVGLRRSMTDTS